MRESESTRASRGLQQAAGSQLALFKVPRETSSEGSVKPKMLYIGPGPGPKNVLVQMPDGAKVVVPYAIWKHKLAK